MYFHNTYTMLLEQHYQMALTLPHDWMFSTCMKCREFIISIEFTASALLATQESGVLNDSFFLVVQI